jgi:hypothetical protein
MDRLSRRSFVALGGTAALAGGVGAAPPAVAAPQAAPLALTGPSGEPDIDVAKAWWPNHRNACQPVGWKDHLFRFNVLYNGTVIAAPCPLERTTAGVRPFAGQGMQLDVTPYGGWFAPPTYRYHLPMTGNYYLYRDDYGHYGYGRQSWAANPTPVLQTDWPQSNGVTIRQSVFAHLRGGGDVATGQEPLYAWIRLSVVATDRPTAARVGIAIRVSRPHILRQYPYTFQDGAVLTAIPDLAKNLDGGWTAPVTLGGGRRGFKIWQPAGPYGAIFTTGPQPTWAQPDSSKYIFHIGVELDAVVGAHTDLVLACVSQNETTLTEECELGYEAALAQADAYWSRQPATASVVDTPEPYVNEALERNVQFTDLVAEKIPGSSQYTYLTGSYGYDVLWTTPTSMSSHMFMDLLGQHESVRRHIELYRTGQGTTPPPGAAYPATNPGYYGTPDHLKAINWLTDHGAVMIAASTHALMTGDRTFITNWLPSLVKACDFIKTACAITGHSGVPGLPPPAVSTDEGDEVVSVWNMAWLYKGLTTTIRLLRRENHARADEFASLAATFRSRFVAAFDSFNASRPKWRHPDGNLYPIYSANLTSAGAGGFGEITLLDTGAMVLVWAGLMDASDQRMVKFCDYFRVGPNAALWEDGSRRNALDRPALIHELSTCEPIYSWNAFHSWQLGDRARFLEAMYSQLVGALSPQTYIPFEHRTGVSACPSVAATGAWLVRHAVLDDSLVDGELQLLRLCPLAWLSTSRDTRFLKMPTIYGPVDLTFRKTGASELTLTWRGTWRLAPTRVYVYAPPGIATLRINGTAHTVPTSRRVEVPVS